MIKGNGHVSLNGVRYLLDEDQQGHYEHRIPGIFAHDESIQGGEGKKQAHINRLTWSMSDWVGGEGNRVYYEDQPNVYDYGVGTNPRIPGQFTSRPKRYQTTVSIQSTDTTTRSHYGRFFDGGGNLYYFVDVKIYKATDGTGGLPATWADTAPSLESTNAFTAACGDQSNIYASAWKDDGSGVSAERTTMYSVDNGTTWRNVTTSETINASDTGEASRNAFFGMCVHNGRLFGWTGRRLFTYDVANLDGTNALTGDQYRKVYDTGSEPSGRVFGNTFWADVIDCGTSVCFFQSVAGRTMVYQYKNGVARPIWTKPGFTTKSIAYNGGALYIAGTFSAGAGSNNPGHGAIYMIPLDSLREIFLKWVRKTIDTNLQMQVAGGAVGDRVTFCAAHTGRLWTYDADYNGFSMLDDLVGSDGSTALTAQEADDVGSGGAMEFTSNSHRISDVYTWGPHVYAGIYRPDTSSETVNQILSWNNDEPASRLKVSNQATDSSPSCFLISPENDMGYPNDAKLLLGFHVSYVVENTGTTSGMLANQQIRLQYALDKGASPTWTTAATLTSATTLPVGGAQGRLYIDLTASSIKFFRLRWRAVVGNNATTGVQAPIVLDVTPEAELLAYDEYYDLILRVKDMQDQTRLSGSAPKSNIQRDQLVTLRKNKTVFDFIDGYIYRENGRVAATKKVFIENLTDLINRNAEGSMQVRLRVVPV